MLVEATEAVRGADVFAAIQEIRGMTDGIVTSILVKHQKSHSLRVNTKTFGKEPNPGGYAELLHRAAAEKFHVIETSNKTGVDIFLEAVRHHVQEIAVA